jgi:hypothetical protein
MTSQQSGSKQAARVISFVATALWAVSQQILPLRKANGDTAPWLQVPHVMRWFAASRRLRGFHVFGVFTEARLAIAPRAVVERLLRLGHIRLFTFPGFKNWSL